MKTLIALTVWQCLALDPSSGRHYAAQGPTELNASRRAVSRCELGDPFGPPTTCFITKCWQLSPAPAPSPTPACTCNPAHTVCTCEIDPNAPGSELWGPR